MLGEEKARLLFTEKSAGERNAKKATQGEARDKPFFLSVTHLAALLRDVVPLSLGV